MQSWTSSSLHCLQQNFHAFKLLFIPSFHVIRGKMIYLFSVSGEKEKDQNCLNDK